MPHFRWPKAAQGLKQKKSAVCFLAGHPGSTFSYAGMVFDRISFAKNLSRHIPLEAFGVGWYNVNHFKLREIGCINSHWDPGSSLCIASHYQFQLVAENQHDWDYALDKRIETTA